MMGFSDAEIDAAIKALSVPGRMADAQELVERAAPGLARVLGLALDGGGWFETAHQAALHEAVQTDDPQQRDLAVRTLFEEETQLTLLVGVAVGFELARELGCPAASEPGGQSTIDTNPRSI
ncbi:MAG: hypothetical protein ACP5H2_11990 [Solirubrobacteraceae bacterium]